jgi:hypothetical protein
MLPQLSASSAAASEPTPRTSAATLTLLSLPHFLVLAIFTLLPVDARLLAAAVCCGWRAVALSERSLWTRLDFSVATSGITRRVTHALFRAACARARAAGGLQALDVSGCEGVRVLALEGVIGAHAGTLCELRVCNGAVNAASVLLFPSLLNLLRVAPQLLVLEADIFCNSVGDASSALRRTHAEGVSLHSLRLHGLQVEDQMEADEAALISMYADVGSQTFLKELVVNMMDRTDAALDAVVKAALACRVHVFALIDGIQLSPASAPALARLLGGTALREMFIVRDTPADRLDVPAATLLADAFRANSTLRLFHLCAGQLWRDAAAADVLLRALAGHPSLRTIVLNFQGCEGHEEHAGALLGALVAANAPSLAELKVSHWNGGDALLRPLFAALPHNMHLRALNVTGNGFSDAFAHDELLPAVRANASLRHLKTGAPHFDGAREAEELLASRPPVAP